MKAEASPWLPLCPSAPTCSEEVCVSGTGTKTIRAGVLWGALRAGRGGRWPTLHGWAASLGPEAEDECRHHPAAVDSRAAHQHLFKSSAASSPLYRCKNQSLNCPASHNLSLAELSFKPRWTQKPCSPISPLGAPGCGKGQAKGFWLPTPCLPRGLWELHAEPRGAAGSEWALEGPTVGGPTGRLGELTANVLPEQTAPQPRIPGNRCCTLLWPRAPPSSAAQRWEPEAGAGLISSSDPAS